MNRAVVAVGSNIEPEKNVAASFELIGAELFIVKLSTLEWTEPVGLPDQPYFLNGAVLLETTLGQLQLKSYLKDLEERLGRSREEERDGPRVIDLDLIVFNGSVVDEDFEKYDFVKRAVVELMPALAGL